MQTMDKPVTQMSKKITAQVIGSPIDVLTWEIALSRIANWAMQRESRVVCICNVHSLVTAVQNADFRLTVQQSDMATPDGMPVALALRWKGFAGQERINGPDLMWKFCKLAEDYKLPVYFYGSSGETLTKLDCRLKEEFPHLLMVGMYSPPFRELSYYEEESVLDNINASGASVVFISLGCPKQELWMANHKDKISAVMIGVGAAFDYHAGVIKRAPLWMQKTSLEWFYRLYQEPTRLWRRYFFTNSKFIYLLVKDMLKPKPSSSE